MTNNPTASWDRSEITRLRTENKQLRDWRRRILDEGFGYDDSDESAAEVLEWAPAWRAMEIGTQTRLGEAEARVDQLTDTLTRRSDALDRTGADNDQLRATLAKASRWVAHFEESIEAACDEEDAVCHGYDVTDDGRCALLADVGQLRAIIRGDARD